MFRFLFAAFALMWMASLFFGAEGAAAGVGLMLLAPVFIFLKVLFILALMGMVFRAFAGHSRSSAWRGHWRPRGSESQMDWRSGHRPRAPEKTAEEQFEEWHDLAHARREVDRWGTYDL